MLSKLLRTAKRQKTRGPQAWSHTVEDYYPIDARSRWAAGRLPHTALSSIIGSNNYSGFLEQLASTKALLHCIDNPQGFASRATPTWNNIWFTALDAASLMTMLAWKKPARYVEIGSGHSTSFARFAVDFLNLPTTVTSIDPNPRKEIDALCDEVIRVSLEKMDLSFFDCLKGGDVVFFDGSHRVFSNSDVTVFFFEILPQLPSGVIVHIHDIFLPDDYPRQWNDRLYSEQYILAAMLLSGKELFDIVAPVQYLCLHPETARLVQGLFNEPSGRSIPFYYPNEAKNAGSSFWVVRR